MSNVFANFESYNELFTKFDPKVIQERYEGLLRRYQNFIEEFKLNEKVYIDEISLQHAVLDYYSDIGRLKDYHKIELTNKVKVISYESYWLWRRKPIQLYKQNYDSITDTEFVFSNEMFVYTNLLAFLTEDLTDDQYNNKKNTIDIDSFFQTLYYFLKFRHCNAQVFELVILAFFAGKQFHQD